MIRATPSLGTVRDGLARAARAPSLHNSQPWRWGVADNALDLYIDSDRLLPSTDAFGRQMVISCGAALNHAEVAFNALGWPTNVTRLPSAVVRSHLATLAFTEQRRPTNADIRLAYAIETRRTDRLPFAEPANWATTEPVLQFLAEKYGVDFEVLGPECAPDLARASTITTSLRRYDTKYQNELHWWSPDSEQAEGVPQQARVSEAELARVPAGRAFPTTPHDPRRADIATDRATVVVLATESDDEANWLRTGEALSAILLEATLQGLATCSLTHVTELPQGRAIVRELLTSKGFPQALVRIGTVAFPESHEQTPRRSIAETVTFT
jgi:nitroreductase